MSQGPVGPGELQGQGLSSIPRELHLRGTEVLATGREGSGGEVNCSPLLNPTFSAGAQGCTQIGRPRAFYENRPGLHTQSWGSRCQVDRCEPHHRWSSTPRPLAAVVHHSSHCPSLHSASHHMSFSTHSFGLNLGLGLQVHSSSTILHFRGKI